MSQTIMKKIQILKICNKIYITNYSTKVAKSGKLVKKPHKVENKSHEELKLV